MNNIALQIKPTNNVTISKFLNNPAKAVLNFIEYINKNWKMKEIEFFKITKYDSNYWEGQDRLFFKLKLKGDKKIYKGEAWNVKGNMIDMEYNLPYAAKRVINNYESKLDWFAVSYCG